MGCVESNEALHSGYDEAPPTPPAAPPTVEKGKKKKKYSIRSKHSSARKDSVVAENLKQSSQSTKITVIWRRYSTFGRRESMKSTKSQEEVEEAGPSQKAPEEEPRAEPPPSGP